MKNGYQCIFPGTSGIPPGDNAYEEGNNRENGGDNYQPSISRIRPALDSKILDYALTRSSNEFINMTLLIMARATRPGKQ